MFHHVCCADILEHHKPLTQIHLHLHLHGLLLQQVLAGKVQAGGLVMTMKYWVLKDSSKSKEGQPTSHHQLPLQLHDETLVGKGMLGTRLVKPL
jgi:hypothetical protein